MIASFQTSNCCFRQNFGFILHSFIHTDQSLNKQAVTCAITWPRTHERLVGMVPFWLSTTAFVGGTELMTQAALPNYVYFACSDNKLIIAACEIKIIS